MGFVSTPAAVAALIALAALAALIPLGLALRRTRQALAGETALRHKLEQQLLRQDLDLRTMFDGFPGLLLVTDAELHYSYVNDYGLRWIGKPRDQVIGHSILENLSETRVAEIINFMSTAVTGAPTTVESHYPPTATRPEAWLLVTQVMGQPDAEGQRSCHAYAIDVTARKRAEDALVAARDEAERANRAKSDFLASMSHELRTPLNAIMGFAQLLATDTGASLQDSHREHAREIVRASRHLLALINDLLDLSMIEHGKLKVSIEPVNVREMLQECVSLLQPLCSKDGISLTLGSTLPALQVLADRIRLRQVILNLGANAIKYNRPRGTVRLSGLAADGQVRIDVHDSGPGLSEEQQARLFQSFERLGAERTTTEGAGLGLALSRVLAHAMDGHIAVSSTLGQGSTFSLTLPMSPTSMLDASLPDPAASEREGTLPGKVLYIEDNRINTIIMEVMMARLSEEAGPVELLTAPTALIGLEMAEEEQPDLILLDLHLPEMTGFEVLQRLRQQEACRDTPVIAFSANSMPAYIEKAMAAGFDHYLSKPVDMDELKRTLMRFSSSATHS